MHFAVVVVVTAVRQFFGNRHISKNCQTFGSSSRHILQESCNVLVISYKMLVSKLYCHCPFLPSSIISLNIEYTLKCQTLRNLVHKKQQKRRGLLCGFLVFWPSMMSCLRLKAFSSTPSKANKKKGSCSLEAKTQTALKSPPKCD